MNLKKEMKYILGCIRRCDKAFHLIEEGDRVLVGVSGGKDSLVLLYALSRYRQFTEVNFELEAVTLDMGFKHVDVSELERFCESIGVPYRCVRLDVAQIIAEKGQAESPCSLCARMRRGALTTTARELNCNKIALGHQREDVMETFLLSLIYEGRMHTFAPITWLDRSDITQIRPMVYAAEARIISIARQANLPVQSAQCTVSQDTERRGMRALIHELESRYPEFRERLCHALETPESYGLWNDLKTRPDDLPKWWLNPAEKPED